MAPDFTKLYGRWKAGEVRKEDKMPPFPKPKKLLNMTIFDEKNLLTPGQKTLLLNSASLGFKLGGFTSLADILDKLGVTVHVVPGIVKRSTKYLEEAKEFWEKKLKSQKESEIARKNLQVIDAELEAVSCECLRGCYIRDQKKILLFPEEMATEYEDKCMNELLVSTLAHETMHAYFNRPDHEHFPYVYFLEEPLAEFGMLLYLQETGIPYTNWASDDVRGKRTCYRYGASLYDKYIFGDSSLRDYLEKYKIYIDEFYIPDVVGGSICLPTPTTSSRRSTPHTPHAIRPSIFGSYDGKIYECIFEKNYVYGRMSNIFKSKNCLFTIPTQCFKHKLTLFRRFYDDTTKKTVSSMEMTIVDDTGHSLLGTGKASVMRNHTINILEPLQSDFQNKYIRRNCVGGTLDVSFYKNVSNDYDWILMVK